MREHRYENRRAKRTPKRQAAWISHGSGHSDVPCVLWDISATGARLSAARPNFLPSGFTLLLSKDGRARKYCRVIWRSDTQLGVEFIEGAGGDDFVAIRHSKVAAPPAPVTYAIGAPRRQLMMPLGGGAVAAGPQRRGVAFSVYAAGLFLLLAAATAVFYAAGAHIGAEAPWALQVCDRARSLCEHPEFSVAASAMMMMVYVAVKGMEL
jgi:hypothetical protein